MKFTLSWLKEHLDTDASLARIGETLTAIGLEVEDIADAGAKLADFIVAEIRDAQPHPNAAKLQVCRVWDGETERQVVCGAVNARAGLKVVLAREGVFIPGSGITIKKAKIRDVESNGMLCSAEELQLAEKSEGIIELPASAVPGQPAAGALGADDPVIDIAITPNRADCLGVRGIARDLAAAGLGVLKPLHASPVAGEACPVSVTLATPNCAHFVGCLIRGVKNGPSPEWLQARLRAVGLRPISALVDITNFMTMAHGRPLHVFDAAKLSGNITVREARHGEKLKALDGKEYELAPGMTVIADEARVLAIAGIIGGEESGCTEDTTDVFLEAAFFNPENIAHTGRKLEILSDARYRFERGVDPGFTETGALIAVRMIVELCGGQASALTQAGTAPVNARRIPFDAGYAQTLGGVEIPPEKQKNILESLGFALEGAHAIPPSWRADVEGRADLVEEILRIHGYDNIPAVPLPKPAGIGSPAINGLQKRVHLARRALAARGMMEVCSWSFLPRAQAEMFGGGQEELVLLNPISEELNTMRPCLLPNLLTAARGNAYRSLPDAALFEVGVQFSGIAPDAQAWVAAGIRSGGVAQQNYQQANFQTAARALDAFDAKADALCVLEQLGVNVGALAVTTQTPAWYHPGRSGALTLGGKVVLAYFGELHPAVAAAFDLAEKPVAAFEVFLQALPSPRVKAGKARPQFTPSAFQAVTRDFAFSVAENVTAAQIVRALSQVSKDLVKDVRIFDVYRGKGVEEGKKSVAVTLVLQAADHTLTDAELAALSDAAVKAAATFGGTLRQ